MEELSPDLMLLTETGLTDDTSDECIAVENYDVVRRDKPKNFTGAQGVAIYIRHGLPFTHRPDLEHQHLMTTAVQINLQHKKPLVVAVVYRHPRTPVAFFNHINELFYHLDSNRFHSVISGDFNINTLPPSAVGTRLLETADTYGFTQVIREPTRVTETSVTCIDLTFTNMNQLYSAGVDKTCIADHFMNYIVLGKMKSSPAKHRMISARNLKRIDEQKWREDMASVPWSVIESFENINEAWSAWKTLFFEVVDEHAPLRKFRAPRSKKKPWKCEEVDELRKLRDHYHHRACTSKRHEDWSMYRQTRNLTTKTARQRKQEHFINGIEENRGNSKGTWTVLKDLLPRKSASSGPLSLEMEGELITELKRVCDVFNDYFIGIGTKLSSCIPAVCHNALDYLNEYLNAVTIPRQPFSFTPVSSNDILRIVNRLSPSKATGLDKIQVRILKLSAQPIATSLTYLFNFSLSSGVFPDDWKIARVCPIHKKGKKSDPGNYRSVSVLPVISKIMERIAHDQMYSYLYDNELLCPQQSGFKKGHSCQTSLHRMTEYVFSELHKGNVVGLVALDLKKAFDTVNHSILLSKMKLYGIGRKELAWFMSYLNNRQQVCCLDACSSDPLTIDCGVPQGSILGPLLFILYVNDLPQCFSECQVNIYADDTAFYIAKRTVTEINEALQTELDQVHNWLCANKLSLHVGKTASMLLCSHQKRRHLQNQHISLDVHNEQIGQVEGLKYLGVHIDQHLNFNQHIDDVCKKNSAEPLGSCVVPLLLLTKQLE
jgi:hypothetical protein